MPKQKIEFTLSADLGFSSLVRRFSEEVFLHAGFGKDWSNRLKLVVDELFMNAVKYGSKEFVGKVYILFEFDEVELRFKIEDEGGLGRKINAEELRKLVDKNSSEIKDITKTSGRGLALISHIWTDEFSIEDSQYGGLAISFIKKMTSEAPPALSPISIHPKA